MRLRAADIEDGIAWRVGAALATIGAATVVGGAAAGALVRWLTQPRGEA